MSLRFTFQDSSTSLERSETASERFCEEKQTPQRLRDFSWPDTRLGLARTKDSFGLLRRFSMGRSSSKLRSCVIVMATMVCLVCATTIDGQTRQQDLAVPPLQISE